MKNLISICLILSLSSTVAFAQKIELRKIYYKKNKTVIVDRCYKDGMCKLKYGDFIRKIDIKKIGKQRYKTKTKGAYVYVIYNYLKDQKDIYSYAKKHSYKRLYIKAKTLSRYKPAKNKKQKFSISNLFVTGSLGVSSLIIDTDIDDIEKIDDGTGALVDIGVGFKPYKNIVTTTNIQYSKFGIGSMTKLYITANYEINKNRLIYQVGVLAGAGQIKFDDFILIENKTTYTSAVFGLQGIVSFKINKHLYMTATAQTIFPNKKFEINNDENLEYKLQNNLIFGVKYNF